MSSAPSEGPKSEPATKEIRWASWFAVGEVRRDGELIAAGVPVHVMTADDGLPGRLELNVGDEVTPVVGLPDQRLRVVWEDFSGGGQKDPTWVRYATGTTMLTILLALALYANTPGTRRRGRT
jgi:hypothetical protein